MKQTVKKAKSTNLYHIAEAHNILVLESQLGNICGFYTYQKKTKIILLNAELSELRKQMVLAHEIGHALLHTKVNCAFIRSKTHLQHRIYEKEANFFGAHLLQAIGYFSEEGFCINTLEIEPKDLAFIQELMS